jgi:uncharacterized protein (TIGR02453 family)
LAAEVFAGFPAEGLKFLRSLERNNKREWFQPRKDKFDAHVKAPMVALVEHVNRGLGRLAPDYITDPSQAIYRIYRDTRFSSDKTPYKTHIAASLRRRGMDKHASAGLYFSVSHKEVEVAGGVYMPGPEQLLAIRQHIAEHHVEFRKLLAKPKLRKLLEDLKGDRLTRVPKGFAADHPAADLLRMKQWIYYVVLDPAIATTPQLAEEVLVRFGAMIPVLEFLNAPLKPRKIGIEDLLY